MKSQYHTYHISARFFTEEELALFEKIHNYKVTEISYVSSGREIDFSAKEEKDFLLKYGTPKILARFGY